jgi:hypothetical protein
VALPGSLALGDYVSPLQGEWRLHEAKSREPGDPATDIPFRRVTEPVAWRVEPRVFVLFAFDGARFAPGLAWSLLNSASLAVLVMAAARPLGFGPSRARSRKIVC